MNMKVNTLVAIGHHAFCSNTAGWMERAASCDTLTPTYHSTRGDITQNSHSRDHTTISVLSQTQLQGVPLATEASISLIILTPIKILQRNLNRSTFVVWEMKRNVSVVRLIVSTRSSGPPSSQPVSCLTRLSADLYVIGLRVPTQFGCCSWVLV